MLLPLKGSDVTFDPEERCSAGRQLVHVFPSNSCATGLHNPPCCDNWNHLCYRCPFIMTLNTTSPPSTAAQFRSFYWGANKQNTPGWEGHLWEWAAWKKPRVLMWEWPLLRGKEKIWWSGLSCWSSGGEKVTRQNPRSVTQAVRTPSGPLCWEWWSGFNSAFPTLWTGLGGLGAHEGGEASAVTRGCGAVVPLISSCNHSKLAKRRFDGAAPAQRFHPDSTHAENPLHISCLIP